MWCISSCAQAGNLGQLGNGNDQHQPTPVPVIGGHAYATISAGWRHTCGLTIGGSLLCWGQPPGNGQDGSPSTTAFQPLLPPPIVELNRTLLEVSSGEDSTCALDSSGSISCFGKPSHKHGVVF